MNTSTPPALRLGPHHFAHLRAVAEGIPVVSAAKRYLGIDHGAEAVTAHRDAVERVRGVARRRGDPRWRLIGLDLRDRAQAPSSAGPSLQQWAEAEGLDGWSEAELLAMYEERFGQPDPAQHRRTARNARLTARRRALLQELEAIAAEKPSPLDQVDGWLQPVLVAQLHRADIRLLGQLAQRIARGGRWWAGLQGVGPTKAARVESLVGLLLGEPAAAASWPLTLVRSELARLSGRHSLNRAPLEHSQLQAEDDRKAIRAWIAARAGSAHTAVQYERESERFLLWCVIERGKALADATPEDCRGYMDFLADVPERWISRRKVPRMAAGWAPFRGPLTIASQQLAIKIVAGLFAWLTEARYLIANPWHLVNRRLGDDPGKQLQLDAWSRAFTRAAWATLYEHLDACVPDASTARLRWICTFVEGTGLRAAELLGARLKDLQLLASGRVIQVSGKGRRNRVVPVPSPAIAATRRYFDARGLDFDTAPPETPLLASILEPTAPVSYRALAQTFKRFVHRAVQASDLAPAERERLVRASAHWLRHTHATRAVEQGVPLDILQENLGQADPRTTAGYARSQLERRQRAIEQAFGHRDDASAS